MPASAWFVPEPNFGKTVLAIHEAFRFALTNPKSIVWWAAPVYPQARIGWRRLISDAPPDLIAANNKQELTVTLVNGSIIQFKSAEVPDHLRGEDVDFIVLDEAAFMREEAWQAIQTTLTRTRGRGLFISTPKWRNWYYEVYLLGLDGKGEWRTFVFPTSANPYIDSAEIEAARGRLPKPVFERDYLAQFKDDFGAAFDGEAVESCRKGELMSPVEDALYYVGADLGRHQDATVLVAVNMESRHVDGFKHIEAGKADWVMLQTEIQEFAMHYNNAIVVLDVTGVGDPIYDELIEAGLNIEPYSMNTNVRKNALIQKLAISLEQGRISYPDVEPLIGELKNYGFKTSETGVIRYNAPSGKKDDCVIALALANWFIADESEIDVSVIPW